MISNNITAIVIVIAAVLVICIALIIYLYLRIRRAEAECDLLVRGTEGKNFVEIVNDNIDQVERLTDDVDELSERYAAVLRMMAGAVQHVGVVRFDAFRDLGGMLSFAVALLDDRGNGLVFSSIYGRSESRTYAKPVVERGSTYELSPEEKEAIRLAMQGRDMGALPVVARDREHEEKIANLRLFHDKEYVEPSRAADEPMVDRRREKPDQAERSVARREQAVRAGEERPGEAPPGKGRRAAASMGPESGRPRRGRVQHVKPTERRDAAKQQAQVDDAPREKPSRRPYDREIERLVEKSGGRSAEPPSVPAPPPVAESEPAGSSQFFDQEHHIKSEEKPAPRARGLNTPVERLRDRDRKGE